MLSIVVTCSHHVHITQFLIMNNSKQSTVFENASYLFRAISHLPKGIIFVGVENSSIDIQDLLNTTVNNQDLSDIS